MASFNWLETPKQVVCVTCGTSAEQRGFVDMIADVDVRNMDNSIVGNIDICICGSCLEQAARLVGSASKKETDDLVAEVIDSRNQIETLKDEIGALNQRHYNFVDKLSESTKEMLN